MSRQPHLLTIDLEDYYQARAFRDIEPAQWYRFERRLEIGTARTLALLDEFGLRATFFVSGWVAEIAPELVRGVADRGHEVASRGYARVDVRRVYASEFREDLARAEEALVQATGQRIVGYRAASSWLGGSDLGVLDLLSEAGYAYDSSLKPGGLTLRRHPGRRFAYAHPATPNPIWEFPISARLLLGFPVSVAGGTALRQLPRRTVARAVAQWERRYDAPLVFHFRTWELDPDQPRINAAPLARRVLHYRGLRSAEDVLRGYLGGYAFQPIARHLGLDSAAVPRPEASGANGRKAAWPTRKSSLRASNPETVRDRGPSDAAAITVVIPCYNEELVVPYLANTLDRVARSLSAQYLVRFIFVNDGSSDGTGPALETAFGSRADCKLMQHPSNRGLSAAILTGIQEADSEIVCSIDCDCTYDPHELVAMVPLLKEGVDLVTASPYHRLGAVRNVPGWRLVLSKSASVLYRLVLRQKLQTYTSCFRVYRRSVILGMELREPGFLGLVELLGKLDLMGRAVVEHPATLEARVLGRSKMKVARTIGGHLGLLGRLALLRLRSWGRVTTPSRRAAASEASG
jgi:polysaccharide deacetylase family protein (PEP-CTERM system associated)